MSVRQELLSPLWRYLVVFSLIIPMYVSVGAHKAYSLDDGIQLQYLYKGYDKYRIETYDVQSIYVNEEPYYEDISITTFVLVEILERREDSFLINNQLEVIDNGLLSSTQDGTFEQFRNGYMIVPEDVVVPKTRNVPQFPLYQVHAGDMWGNLGQENTLLPEANTYYLLNVNVEYEYKGEQPIPESLLLLNKTSYTKKTIAPYFEVKYHIQDQTLFNQSINQFLVYSSSFEIGIWWNVEEGRIEYILEDYVVTVRYPNNDVVTFAGTISGIMFPIEEMDTSIASIQEELESLKDDIEISSDNNGIVFRLQNILFQPDSPVLQATEKEKLDAIAQVLSKFKGRRILVEGHTALANTPENRKKLSTERAHTVMKHLRETLQWDDNQFLYRGFGAEKPLGSNYTEEGRKKNRRVEITILEN